jgi:hypothetical protein
MLIAAAACAALLTATVAAAGPLDAASATAATANSATFTDSTGEDPQGPDITTVVVSNNDAGQISFRMNIPNRPTLGADMILEVWVDSDNNVQTGSPDLGGADYVMQVVRNEIALYKWDGTDYTRRFGDPSAVTLSFSYQGGITIRISANELGNTKRFKFFVVAISGIVVDPVTGDLDGSNSKADVAPGGGAGLYPFEVKTAPTRLVVRSFAPRPAKPVAGRTLSLRLRAVRSDTGAGVRGGRVICAGRVGGTALRAQSGRFVGTEAVCTWAIPANAKGKTFRGSVTIVFEGLRTTRSFSRRIG